MSLKNHPNKHNILIIDDEYLSAYICEKFIKKVISDSEIMTCPNGKNAIEKLQEINNSDKNQLPDYIFLAGYDTFKIIPHRIRLPYKAARLW